MELRDTVSDAIQLIVAMPEADDEKLVEALVKHGVTPLQAEVITAVVPIALGRAEMSKMPEASSIPLPDRALIRDFETGKDVSVSLSSVPEYAIALELAGKVDPSALAGAAARSAEISCLKQLCDSGKLSDNVVLTEPIFCRLAEVPGFQQWVEAIAARAEKPSALPKTKEVGTGGLLALLLMPIIGLGLFVISCLVTETGLQYVRGGIFAEKAPTEISALDLARKGVGTHTWILLTDFVPSVDTAYAREPDSEGRGGYMLVPLKPVSTKGYTAKNEDIRLFANIHGFYEKESVRKALTRPQLWGLMTRRDLSGFKDLASLNPGVDLEKAWEFDPGRRAEGSVSGGTTTSIIGVLMGLLGVLLVWLGTRSALPDRPAARDSLAMYPILGISFGMSSAIGRVPRHVRTAAQLLVGSVMICLAVSQVHAALAFGAGSTPGLAVGFNGSLGGALVLIGIFNLLRRQRTE